MTGGRGDDTFHVDTIRDVVTEFEGEGRDMVVSRVAYTLPDAVEDLQIIGADLKGTGNALNNDLFGFAGSQSLLGLAGDDRIDGGAGADSMSGGLGSDSYVVDHTGDQVIEGNSDPLVGGVDVVRALIDYTLTANVENLFVDGDGLTGTGNRLNNFIRGGDGAQTLLGLGGDDRFAGGAGSDHFDGGAGFDIVDYSGQPPAGSQGIFVNLLLGKVREFDGAFDSIASVEGAVGTKGDDRFLFKARSLEDPKDPLRPYKLFGGAGEDLFEAYLLNAPAVGDKGLAAEASGGSGNDTFKAGTAAYTFDGGSGIDVLDLSRLEKTGRYGQGWVVNLVEGFASTNDRFEVPGNNKNFEAGLEQTNKVSSVETIIGSRGYDAILGTDENETIDGNGGGDRIDAGGGDDTVMNVGFLGVAIDSAGNDTYIDVTAISFANNRAGIAIDLGTGRVSGWGDDVDLIRPHDGRMSLGATEYGDSIDTGAYVEYGLSGHNGDDAFTLRKLGLRESTVHGGDGIDTIDLRPSAVSLQTALSADGQSLLLAEAGTYFFDALQIWEVERFYLGGGDDSFFVSDASLGPGNGPFISFLNGGLGNDRLGGGTNGAVIDGDEGVDSYRLGNGFTRVDLQAGTATGEGRTLTLRRIEKVYGDDVNDTLLGARRADFLAGGKGIDTIDGREGNDTLHGGEGDDTLSGGLGDDTINGDAIDDADAPMKAAGTDTVTYAAAAAAVTVNLTTGKATGEGADTLINIENVIGTRFADAITGNAGRNVLNGGNGNDVLAGGAGNDSLIGGQGSDTVEFSKAKAAVTVDLAAGRASGEGADSLSGIENVRGSAFGDVISGSSSRNTLNGGDGRDTLNGGTGADTLTGGKGRDTFVHDRRDAMDTITDFSPGQDRLEIDNAIFANLTSLLLEGSLRAAQFLSGPVPLATAEAQFLYETDTGILRFDADGAGGLNPVLVLRLANRAALSAADIEII